MIIIFVESIDQLIDYSINCASFRIHTPEVSRDYQCSDFLPAHPESRTHIFCFGTRILNLSESQDSQSYSGKFCNGCNNFLVGLTLYSPNESWDAQV